MNSQQLFRRSAFTVLWLFCGFLMAGGSLEAAIINIAQPGQVNTSMLSEWGVTISTTNAQNSYVFPGAGNIASAHQGSYVSPQGQLFDFWIEDTSTGVDQVGPGYGNQDYDAEYLGLTIESGGRVSIALSTGQRPDNTPSPSHYSPGDIMIKTLSGNVYGIEVGGNPLGNPVGTALGGAIFEGANGYTYNVNPATGLTVDFTQSSHVAGSIWLTSVSNSDDGWIMGKPFGPAKVQLMSSAGTYMGMADFAFSLNALGTQHSALELSFDASFMGADQITEVFWAPGCGNDQAMILNISRSVNPEPASLAIWAGIGLGGTFLTWRRQRLTRRDGAAGQPGNP